jgi:hypothetical protein
MDIEGGGADLYWDGRLLRRRLTPANPVVRLSVARKFDFGRGPHRVELRNMTRRLRAGAMRIRRAERASGREAHDDPPDAGYARAPARLRGVVTRDGSGDARRQRPDLFPKGLLSE